MNRRQALLRAFGAALAVAKRSEAADAALRFAGLDHIEFTVADVGKSLAFYIRIFGITVMKNNQTTRRYIKLGSAYMALDQAAQIRVDHFCAGIDGFDVAQVHAELQRLGIAYRDFPSGKDLAVTDPDAIRTQLATSGGWDQLATGTASPESAPLDDEPIFRATGLDHILLNVADPEKSAAFYEKIFGPATERGNNRIWFQAGKSRIGLLQTPAGQRAGVNRYCVSAAGFDYQAVTKQLTAAGARLQEPEVAGAPQFRDPDGFLVQVMRA